MFRLWERALAIACSSAVLAGASGHRAAGQEVVPKLELTIGEIDGAEEYVFSRVLNPLFAPDDRIVVMSSGSGDIRVFDEAGDFVFEFGGTGNGPGEFVRARYPVITPDSQLIVYDATQRRVTTFDLSGAVLQTERIEPIPNVQAFVGWVPVRHGHALAVTQGAMSPLPELHDPRRAWILVGRSGLDTIGHFRVPVPIAHWETSDDAGQQYLDGLGPRLGGAVALLGDSLVAVAHGRTGIVRYLAIMPDGLHEVRRVTLGFAAYEVSRADQRELEQVARERPRVPPRANIQIEVADYWSVASAAVFSDDGHLWIATHPDPDGAVDWRVIDPEGSLLDLRVRFPEGFRPTSARAARILGEYTDELGVPYVQVYTVPRVGRPSLH